MVDINIRNTEGAVRACTYGHVRSEYESQGAEVQTILDYNILYWILFNLL